ncbi:unnamed protein product [Closterium sp. Naga37s-1]|nr:unnamed protein product [Closterium sp. Naga37s-1]
MAFSWRGASPRLLESLLLLSLSVLRIDARHGSEIAVAGAHSRSSIPGDASNSHQQFDSQSPEVGASGGRQNDPSAASGGGGAANAGSNGAESIAEWKRRSAEAGAHFFPLQRAEDAPSRDELHRRILASRGVGGGLKDKGEAGKVSKDVGYPLPPLEYDSTLLSTANGTMGNTMVNYSTPIDNNHIRLLYAPHRAPLAACHSPHPSRCMPLAAPLQPRSSVTFRPFLPFLPSPHPPSLVWPHQSTPSSKPFSTLASTTLKYISCVDQRCMGGSDYDTYGCNTEGLPNYLNTTGLLPGDDALCVYNANAARYDYYEADAVEGSSYLQSTGHVVEDTVYLTAPDGTEVNRSIVFGCGVNQKGYWGMQGWQYGSWAAGGVLGLGWYSPFLYELTAIDAPSSFAMCLEEPLPTNKTGWDGKVPLQTGSSHLTIGATGLPAGASYASLLYLAGMQYSHITLTTAKRALNITDDPAYVDPGSYLPADFPKNATPGFLFMPESFVHLLRYPLFMSLVNAVRAPHPASACVCLCLPACACACLRVPVPACVCLCLPACACACLRVPLPVPACASACLRVPVPACVCLCLCLRVPLPACVCLCLCLRVPLPACVCLCLCLRVCLRAWRSQGHVKASQVEPVSGAGMTPHAACMRSAASCLKLLGLVFSRCDDSLEHPTCQGGIP